MTNTKIKFVVVVESVNTALRDNEIRTVSFFIISLSIQFLFIHRNYGKNLCCGLKSLNLTCLQNNKEVCN